MVNHSVKSVNADNKLKLKKKSEMTDFIVGYFTAMVDRFQGKFGEY